MGARCHVRARAARSRLHSVRKNETYDPPITRRTVVDEYGAGPLEKAGGSDRGVLRRGGKRDFSPYLNRGLGESHSTRVREYARKVCGPYLVDTKAGNNSSVLCGDPALRFCSGNLGIKVYSVLVAMCVKNEYID